MTAFRALRAQVPWRPRFAEEHAVFAAVRGPASLFETLAAFPSPEQIHERLSPLAGVSFVRAPERRVGPRSLDSLYDGAIHTHRTVPTRSGSWHDLLNALVWAIHPRAKWSLHARQFELVRLGLDPATGRLPGARTREQDALALFDEGGLVVESPEPLTSGAAIEESVAAGRARAVVFGHAIYEGFVLGSAWPMVRAIVVAGDPDESVALRLADREASITPEDLPRVRLMELFR